MNDVARRLAKELSKPTRFPSGRPVDRCSNGHPLTVSKVRMGWGYCETCGSARAVPIGRVESRAGDGKFVYVKEALMSEFRAEFGSEDMALEAFEHECRNREWVVINLY